MPSTEREAPAGAFAPSGVTTARLQDAAERLDKPRQENATMPHLPFDHAGLVRALRECVKPCGGPSNGGLDNHMWAAAVDRTGVVRAVCYSGAALGEQWPGSRAIAIAKANTANALSLPAFAFSTANLYYGAQPGGVLFGLPTTNPVDTATMYGGDTARYGTPDDPMIGKKASGVVVFGGGLALYDRNSIVGALGISGDTSCGDHNVAWRVRKALGLDRVPAGITADNNDAIIYDIGMMGKSSSGYGHPVSGLKEDDVAKEIGASASGK
jgi:uncharacterized protein GlcG (DUF336 family)